MTPLCDLGAGLVATIAEIRASPELGARLSAMGLRVGKSVEMLRRGSFFGPLHIRVGTTDIAMRRIDAALVLVGL